jgi:ribonuclease Z
MAEPAIIVTFLGTSSGTPTSHRNLACVALQRAGELILFDCGEAAQIQYRRAGLPFGKLTAICISHMHGDHVTGLMGLLMSLQMAERTAPLRLYGAPGLEEYVRCNRRTLHTAFAYRLQILEAREAQVLWETEEYRVRCAPLDHRLFCLGFALEEAARPGRFQLERARALGIPEGPLFGRLQRGETVVLPDGRSVAPEEVLGPPRRGLKVAYCTDTRPSKATIEMARDADLLIHEGTFAADVAAEANMKGHSTVVQAADIARRAGVRRLALTHISPRYADASLLRQQARAVFPESVVADDLSRICLYHEDEPPATEPK